MDTEDVHAIIERLYDAALDPTEWDTALRLLQEQFSSTAAGLFIQHTLTGEFTSARMLGIEEDWLRAYDQRYARVNPWFVPECLMGPGSILTDQCLGNHYQDSKYFEKTEFYNDWAKPQEFRHAMGGTLTTDGQNYVNFTYFRPACHGPYTQQEIHLHQMLSGHIRKAVEVGDRLQGLDGRFRAFDELLESMGHGIIFLDRQGRVSATNRTAEALLAADLGLAMKCDRLRSQRQDDDGDLQQAIGAALGVDPCQASVPRPLTLKRRSGRASLSLVVLPIPRQQGVPPAELAAVVCVTEPDRPPLIDEDHLCDTYGLTSKEVLLAQRLAVGDSLRAAAADLGVSYQTTRWHLKSIFQKTGTRRQADLVRLLVSDLAADLSKADR